MPPFMPGLNPLPPMPSGGELQDVLNGNMAAMGGMMQSRQDEASQPPINYTIESKDGQPPMVKAEMTYEQLQRILAPMAYTAQAMKSMTSHVNELETREQEARRHPLLHVLSTVAGELAQDKRLPPVVSALGRANLRLNPSPDELAGQRMGIQAEQARIGESQARLAETMLQHREVAADRSDRLAETKREHGAQDLARTTAETEKVKAETAAREDARFKTALTHYDADLKNTKGKEVPRPVFEAGMKAYGVTDKEKIAAAYESYRSAAVNYREAQTEKAKEDQFRRANSPSVMKMNEDNENAQALAEHIVKMKGQPGLADSLRQVTGAFGAYKAKVMAKIIKLDPSFSEAKIERMVKMEDDISSATGKGGQQLVSFGTFSRHAGDLSDVYKELSSDMTTAPILNKGWQWILKNTGDPRVARVYTALAPVKKEYETFLLNNRALYQMDRKEVDELQSPTMSPQSFMQSLNQMGQTVKAKYGELGKQYQNLTGVPLQNTHPLSQEAVTGLRKIGIEMPVPQTDSDPLGVLK